MLLGFFQLPLLTEHYHQYLTGYFTAVDKEVAHIKALATKHNYPDAYSLLAAHAASELDSVKDDAEHKLSVLKEHSELTTALAIFNGSTLAPKLRYMLNPKRGETLKTVLENFKPGIPLSPGYLLGSAIAALVFNFLLLKIFCEWPLSAILHRRMQKKYAAQTNPQRHTSN